MDMLVFYQIEQDCGIRAMLSGDNTLALRQVISFSEREGVTKNGVREYVIRLLADDENVLSALLRTGRRVGDSLYRAALSDLEQIFDVLLKTPLSYTPSDNPKSFFGGYIESIRRMCAAADASELLELLCTHYKTLGNGVLSRYVAFKYEGKLRGVVPDTSVTFDTLVGLEHQKKVLLDNTRALISGRPANNVLLFGDRGTGKSSCVKALLNMMYRDGLRVIEFPKEYISHIPQITGELADSPHKYLIFLDDLSFESHDGEYRALKIAMEGQLQANPENVAIYATSNRRHLIKETWADREGGEVHKNDNLQETLSLSERFGISLVFAAPNQAEYLKIVKELLARHGIEIDADLEKQAIVWQMKYGSRNPRSAKQFVSSYLASVR